MDCLIVTDLDGTLLNHEHRLGAYTRTVLDALWARGIEVMLASGRHHRDMRGICEQVSYRGYLISSNGAAVHDEQGRLVDWCAIDPECLDFLLRDPLFDRVHTNVYLLDEWLVETPEPALLGYHQDSGFAYRVADFGALAEVPVVKVYYYHTDAAHLRDLERVIEQRYGDRLCTTYALPVVLEVMAKGVSKGDALDWVLQRTGRTREQVIAFGDGRNDLELLSVAGKGLLMSNAVPALKAALPTLEVIGSNAEESVARYLERLLGGAGLSCDAIV